jgi:Flp pilus assembly pilin Flp
VIAPHRKVRRDVPPLGDMNMRKNAVTTRIIEFARQESGQDLMEYGLLVSLIATFLVGSMTTVGARVFDLWALIAAIPYPN